MWRCGWARVCAHPSVHMHAYAATTHTRGPTSESAAAAPKCEDDWGRHSCWGWMVTPPQGRPACSEIPHAGRRGQPPLCYFRAMPCLPRTSTERGASGTRASCGALPGKALLYTCSPCMPVGQHASALGRGEAARPWCARTQTQTRHACCWAPRTRAQRPAALTTTNQTTAQDKERGCSSSQVAYVEGSTVASHTFTCITASADAGVHARPGTVSACSRCTAHTPRRSSHSTPTAISARGPQAGVQQGNGLQAVRACSHTPRDTSLALPPRRSLVNGNKLRWE